MVDILPGAAAAMDYVVAAIEEHLAPAHADGAPVTEKVLD
jgi:hypothetical protein